MKKNLLLSLALATLCVAGGQAQERLFDSPFTSDYNESMPYRIPAIVKTTNDEIIVFADKRHGGGDVGQVSGNSHIDLVYKRSTDNGATWGDEQTIIRGSKTMGYGDAAVVADREDPKKILIMCAAGNVFFTSSKNSDGNRLQCYRFRSTDGGYTWQDEDGDGTVGQDVTGAIYSTTLANNYYGAFFSSGRICQSSQIKVGDYYRLYAALCTRKSSTSKTYSIVVYSDDFGDTWNVLGGSSTVAVESGNEAKCEEMPNGSVLVSSRKSSGRYFNVFNYTSTPTTANTAEGSWNGRATGLTGKDDGATNGEILLVPAYGSDGNEYNVLLQSLPFESSRKAVGICWTVLTSDAITQTSQITELTWTDKAITTENSAYSSMILQGDGNIGFVYEDEYDSSLGTGGYDIKYWNLSLETITGGAYTTTAPSTEPVDPEFSLSQTAVTLTEGETTQLTLTTNSDGAVTYTSSNTAVATVSTNGVVTAVAAGTATITATVAATETYNAASATCTITVKAKESTGGDDDEEPETPATYTVTPVAGTIDGTTYYIASFSANEATTLPSSVKAYYVKSTSSDVVTLTRITSGMTIPKNEGVLLMASSADAFTVTTTTDESNVATLTGNCLVAAVNGEIPSGAYVLAVKGSGDYKGQFAFCLTSSALTLSSNRAYLTVSSAAPQFRMRVEGETTGIDNAQLTIDNAPVIYDLLGRRVTEMQPGRIYIVNGKKVMND